MRTLTRWLWLVWLGAALVAPASAAAQGPGTGVRLTIEPTMIKGPPTARVTIVEFSDYQ